MSTSTTINHHETDASLFATLARVFGAETATTESGNVVRWVTLNVEGVTINFYARKEA